MAGRRVEEYNERLAMRKLRERDDEEEIGYRKFCVDNGIEAVEYARHSQWSSDSRGKISKATGEVYVDKRLKHSIPERGENYGSSRKKHFVETNSSRIEKNLTYSDVRSLRGGVDTDWSEDIEDKRYG